MAKQHEKKQSALAPLMNDRISNDHIRVYGAREHNLKNIDVAIPKGKLTVITGPSGSGKSSLALDILFTEGKRRYVESLSSYARQFLGIAKKPEVDRIDGLCPAIAIDQKTVGHNPRSTVGTITEIYDYLRVLFARIGVAHCPDCSLPIKAESPEKIEQAIRTTYAGQTITIAAPVVVAKKGEFTQLLLTLYNTGYYRFRIDGVIHRFRSADEVKNVKLAKTYQHTIDLLMDQVEVTDELTPARLLESIETSFKLASGLCKVIAGDKEQLFSSNRMCLNCGHAFPELEPRFFSFNSPIGACPDCNGLGMVFTYSNSWYPQQEEYEFEAERTCDSCHGARLNKRALSVFINKKNIYQIGELSITDALKFCSLLKLEEQDCAIADPIVKEVVARLTFLQDVGLAYLSLNRTARTLSGGEGQRIRLATQIGSALSGVLYILDEPSIGLHQRDNDRLINTLKTLRDQGNTVVVVEHDVDTMRVADYIIDMGPAAGIHGGTVTATGTPTQLAKNKNSLSGAYLAGTKFIAVPEKVRVPKSWLTLNNAKKNNLKDISVSFPLGVLTGVCGVSGSGKSTLIMEELVPAIEKELNRPKRRGVSETNAANTAIAFVKQQLAQGFSLKAKASINSPSFDTFSLRENSQDERESGRAPDFKLNLEGAENLESLVVIDQSPIGRTPRSNPATYLGIFNEIRELYTQLPESKARGYKPGRFSFNVAEGRCFECAGDGTINVSMQFLPDVVMICKSCKGQRYNSETLSIRYKNKNIAQVLEMTAFEALTFFEAHKNIAKRLRLMCEVGLDYIKLGQPSTTLSGGEAQRIKLVDELAKRGSKTMYILDEPTTGLHSSDIEKLLKVLNRLVDKGNSMIVIEHNLDVLKTMDYLIDMGPEGGDAGGQLIAKGTPKEVSANPQSHTGKYLARHQG